MTQAPVTAEQLAAKRLTQIKGALGRYRFMANFTGVFLLILCVEVIYKWVVVKFWLTDLTVPSWMDLIGIVHGWGYVIYLGFTVDLGSKVKWPSGRFFLTMLAGTIPFASFYFEKKNSDEIRAKYSL